MATSYWQGVMIQMLRVLINDNPSVGTYTYTDPRLVEILIVAASYVTQEITFSTTYDIDVVYNTIDPDPYTLKDKLFMNMVSLKAACIVDQGQYRCKALLSGLEARCGPAMLRTVTHLQGFKDLLELGPCAMYEKLKEENSFSGDSLNSLIHFVLSPFVGNDFDPTDVLRNYDEDYRFVR